ncbi:porin family protein [Fibrobacter sp. UWB11]|uniref:porin family protein n=1 Tax=Fibrobacter sp. UWB11 TaxID=1896202 RepID=UPI000927C332|nr:porin family protein [Fibrobacter sp. UWB11]SIO11555.1 Outer membrane protein beta-barrel domain-containing protein [Fibrobacter sp. UWB11]
MKKFMIASAIAMMCLSANAFAEDDGYGNDIPPARSEGTVDDGYGNKLPVSNEPEYKTFEEARASSYGSPSNSSSNNQGMRSRLGVHLGLGVAFVANYPTDKDFVKQYGDNEWVGVSGDIGLIFMMPLNPILSFVPELNFGLGYLSEEIKGAGGDDDFWGEYKVNDAKSFYNINIPLMLRLHTSYVYLEGGIRLSFNFDTDHEYEYTDAAGEPLKYYDPKDGEYKTVKRAAEDEWKIKTFIPSVVGGIGTSFSASGLQCDLGLRFIWDLRGIEDRDTEIYASANNTIHIAKVVENKSSLFALQLVFNVFF